MQTIVIGHKNPDMDSVCAAVGYARLKQALGVPDVLAARAGNTNERIDYVLERFGVDAPAFLSDVSPRIEDVMERDVVAVPAGTPVYDAIQIIDRRRVRVLPVLDGGGRLMGLLSAFKVNRYLFPPREEASGCRKVVASLQDIVRTFAGEIRFGVPDEGVAEHMLVVGAMGPEAFAERLKTEHPDTLVVIVQDQPEIQRLAVEAGVRALIITGGVEPGESVADAAAVGRAVVAVSPHDTATTVLLARGAANVERMLDAGVVTFSPETPLEAARERASKLSAHLFPVLDDAGRMVGIISKSDFLKPVRRQLVLVDHNELGQAVKGADKIPIVEVLDHHRLGGLSSHAPMMFWNLPVGSTSTLVALAYRQHGVTIPRDVAGLLMSGLISDTLNLTSPTATAFDKEVLGHLSRIAGVEPSELAEKIFSVGSPLLTMTPEQAIQADCKEYEEDGIKFTVAQIEELGFSHYDERETGLLEALEVHCKAHKLAFAALLVTDVNTQNSRLLMAGEKRILDRVDYPELRPRVWDLAGVVSRKKQLLPYLLQCLGAAGGAS